MKDVGIDGERTTRPEFGTGVFDQRPYLEFLRRKRPDLPLIFERLAAPSPPRSSDAARASPDGAAGARLHRRGSRARTGRHFGAEAIASGISLGTELALYRGASPFASKRFDVDLRLFVEDSSATFPARLGYEWVGVVRESTADELRVGSRIHVTLPHRETQTFAVEGPPWIMLPDELSAEKATLLQSVAIALQAVRDAQITGGDRVAVFGLGTFGLLAVQLARLEGAGEVVAVDPLAARRALARDYGAGVVLDPTDCDVGLELKSSGRPADVAIRILRQVRGAPAGAPLRARCRPRGGRGFLHR